MSEPTPNDNKIELTRIDGRVDLAFAQLSVLTDTISGLAKQWDRQRNEDREALREHREQEQRVWSEVTKKLGSNEVRAEVAYSQLKPVYKAVIQIGMYVIIAVIGAIMGVTILDVGK